MVIRNVILVITDGSFKMFSDDQEDMAREYAKRYNNGVLYWRDDYYQSKRLVNQTIGTVESNANVIGLKIDRIG